MGPPPVGPPPGQFPGPGVGYAPGFYPMPGRYQPPKSSAGVIAAVAIAGVFLLVTGLIATMALIDSDTSYADAGYDPYDVPSYTYTPPAPTSYSATYSTTTSYSAPSSSYETYSSTYSSTTTEEPEPIPAGPQPVYALSDHPLFASTDTGLPNVGCQLSRWSADRAGATRFYRSGIKCLNKMWRPMLADLNLPYTAPNLSVPSSSEGADSPCSAGNASSDVAFYCPRNKTIYMPMNRWRMQRHSDKWPVILSDLAHEYAHHVQAITGIADAAWEKQYEAGTNSSKGLEISRRSELQAQCFAGMFFGSAYAAGWMTDNPWDTAARVEYETGDYDGPRTHGKPQHYGSWWEHGSRKNRAFECNTWSAKASQVS